MDQELKKTTIKSLIENLSINNKFLSSKDIDFLKNKFINSNRKLKDIENQINYEISKIEKKNVKKQRQEKNQEENNNNLNKIDKENIDNEYTLFSYESRGISSSKKVKIENIHLGEENLNKPMHVVVNNSLKGYLKMQDNNLIDDVDLAISQIGKLLKVKITEIYRVEDSKHNTGILSVDINNNNIKENRTIGAIINSHYNDVLHSGRYFSWMKELMSLPESNKENIIKDEVSLKSLIDIGYLVVFEEYPNMSETEKQEYKQKYLEMLVFDFLTNQLDRNSENFGISITKNEKVVLSSLYDNGCVIDYDHLDENATRFMMKICDRTELIKVVFKYYFNTIEEFVRKIIANSDIQTKIDNIIDVYLDENDALWYKGVIDLNLKVLEKLYRERKENPKKTLDSTGYATTIQYSVIVVMCCIILGFIIGLLFVMKTK